MARKTQQTRPMHGNRELYRDAGGEWRVRVSLRLFGRDVIVFGSSEGYKAKADAYANCRLIFFGDWSEEAEQDGNEETSNGPNESGVPDPGTDGDNR